MLFIIAILFYDAIGPVLIDVVDLKYSPWWSPFVVGMLICYFVTEREAMLTKLMKISCSLRKVRLGCEDTLHYRM